MEELIKNLMFGKQLQSDSKNDAVVWFLKNYLEEVAPDTEFKTEADVCGAIITELVNIHGYLENGGKRKDFDDTTLAFIELIFGHDRIDAFFNSKKVTIDYIDVGKYRKVKFYFESLDNPESKLQKPEAIAWRGIGRKQVDAIERAQELAADILRTCGDGSQTTALEALALSEQYWEVKRSGRK